MTHRIPHFLSASALALAASGASADQVILDDLIVDGSACIGLDCVNGESFGFDTIRIKENNLRIKAEDTSSSASFPTQDWELTFNDSSNGGANKFSVTALTPSSGTPFTIEASSQNHALYVDDGGRIGFGTNSPVADLHVKSGNTPTLRLEQDGSSGFGAQTWDVAGNEANFFVRDASNGSTLPLRIFPSAPSNALTIEGTTGDIGLGTTAPTAPLHIADGENKGITETHMLINNTSATQGQRLMLAMSNFGGTELQMENRATDVRWNLRNANGGVNFIINDPDSAETELTLTPEGNLRVEGNFISNGTTLTVPDYVFDESYDLMPITQVARFISENRHLPKIPSASDIARDGINMSHMQMALLEKIEELTLYAIEQQAYIGNQDARLGALELELETLRK